MRINSIRRRALRVAAVEGFEPMKYLSLTYALGVALVSTAIGLMLYRLRYLNKVTA